MRRAAQAIAARLERDLEVLEISGWGNSEGRARSARYSALLGHLEDGEWLLTGHNLDDQAETLLLNLLRGTGLDGLAGIPAVRPPIARPLLDVRRSDIRELATLLSLPWQEDPANLDRAARRNRIRASLIPHLESEWNPNLSDRLASLARVTTAEVASIADETILGIQEDGKAQLPAALLWAIGERRAGHSIRAALRRLRSPHPPTAEELGQVVEVLAGRRPRVVLAGGVEVRRNGPWLVMEVGSDSPADVDAVRWEIPGRIAWGGFELEARIVDQRPAAFPLSAWSAVMDADRLEPLFVRAPSDRDHLEVPGGTRPLIEVIKASGVDGQAAANWPVVESGTEIVWVPGIRGLPPGWIDGSTRRYLWVSAEEVAWPR
jgi:tRNA(Ile)-lysidine synthase